jgi:putative transposase
MLSTDAFEQWCQRLDLSEKARTLIAHIRSSPPSRLVRSAAGNVSGRYPSQKMRCTIQFESHRDELAAVYEMEHDPLVLEFYDQPGRIKLTYQGNKKQLGVWHTPDFFVLRKDEAGWVECKIEETLLQLAQTQPHRYHHHPDGTWSCPPGEAYAKSLGLFYRIRSSRENDWTYLRNLRFLEEYLRGPRSVVAAEVVESVRTAVMRKPGMTLLELLRAGSRELVDDIYFLMVTDQIYVDLTKQVLAEPERVQVFLDREMAVSYVTLPPSSIQSPHPSTLFMRVGTRILWDGFPWTVMNPGETEVTLLSEDKQLRALPINAFDALWQGGKITGVPSQTESDWPQGAAQLLLAKASPKHLETALQRYKALGNPAEASVSPRTLRRWRTRFHAAEASYGNGYVGLLPDWNECGDRTPRIASQAELLLETFIVEHYETLKQQPKREVYLLLQREADHQKLPAPSYSTFLRRIAQRSRPEVIRKRQGPRAAAQHEPFYWELERTTPKHGDRPWDVVHLDHTLLDVELVSARSLRPLGRPWATFMTDAFSRRLLVVYLTFDPPSYRSCLMTLRECVWRYGRLPQTLIVDGGPDFRSTYFETLLAYYGCTKATRPWAQPRYGSVCERLFGTANTQLVFNLAGNTQITKHVRLTTKSVDPKRQAVWTLGDLYCYLCKWAYEVYDQETHPALGMTPREAFKAGLAVSGERAHCKILYDEEFCFLSLASPRKGTAQVEPGRGVKVNYLYYWSEAFLSSALERTQVPVRYDPFDIGIAYAYVRGRWVQCRSEYYLQLRGHTERELHLVSHELRKRYQNHAGEAAVTAKRLADFLAEAESHEQILMQRLQDVEAREVFAQMGGHQLPAQEPPPTPHPSSSVSLSQISHDALKPVEPELDAGDDVLEDLDEYEEFGS